MVLERKLLIIVKNQKVRAIKGRLCKRLKKVAKKKSKKEDGA